MRTVVGMGKKAGHPRFGLGEKEGQAERRERETKKG